MKLHQSSFLMATVICGAIAISISAQGPRGGPPNDGPPPAPGTGTTISGTVVQLNYNPDAEVDGFLLNNKTLIHLLPPAASQMAMSLRPGDSVEVKGYQEPANETDLQIMVAQDIQDRTSGKTFRMPQPGAPAPFSGSGRIEQMNYGPDGSVNGFLLGNGTLATIPPFAASNPSAIHVGANVAYSGYARNTFSGRTVVEVQTLTMNGRQLTLNREGPEGDGPPPPPRPRAVGEAPPPPTDDDEQPPPPPAKRRRQPPAPQPPSSAPAGRTEEPPPPPPPQG